MWLLNLKPAALAAAGAMLLQGVNGQDNHTAPVRPPPFVCDVPLTDASSPTPHTLVSILQTQRP